MNGTPQTNLPGLLPERVSRRPPANLDPADEALFAHEYLKAFGAVESRLLSDLRILPNGFLVKNRMPLPESFVSRPAGLRRAKVAVRALQHGIRASRGPELGRALFVTDEHSNGFFHWICDVLPRLEVLDAAAPREMRERTLVVPAMADFPYVRASLAPYGIDSPRVLGAKESVRCSNLLVVPGAAPTGNYRPALMRAMRDRFRRYFEAGTPERRLFISRAQAPRRRIANEGELEPILKRHGFESVVLERFPLEEQIRLMASASIVVGNHGAGLTHLAWMAPGTRVLELRRRGDGQNNCYYSLASALEVDYYYLQCEAVDPREGTHVVDFIVDPAAFERTIALVEGGS